MLVQDAELEGWYGKVRSLQERDAKRARRGRSLVLGLAIAEGAVILGLTYSLVSITPAVRVIPAFVWVRQDGTTDAQVAMSSLPADAQNAVLRATLWQYVLWREGYSADTARFRHDFVVALSSGTVGKQFENWFNYPNPSSPQVTIGNNGTIAVEQNYADFRENDPHTYEVTFTRTTKVDGRPEQRAKFRASVHFKQLVSVPTRDRTTINPAGIQVISYPDPIQLDAPPTQEKRS